MFEHEINELENLKCENDSMILKGNVPILFSAPHTMHQSKEDGTIKLKEPYTKAIALYLNKSLVKHSMELNDNEARAYLSGQTLNYEGEKGWYLINYKGYSLGWGKLAGQIMKNHYPKGLRKN